jgi:hypothetical protein
MARIATALWIVWAIVVWNVVFDHVIVVAGREYISAATAAARAGTYARMDDWMRPAIARGLWIATAASATILLVGFAAIRRAAVKNPAKAQNPAKAGSHVPEHDRKHDISHEDKTAQGEGIA